jgi:hypothetical protein
MRGENRDYIPKRQSGVKESTCEVSEGCAFKAKATKRRPHYRNYAGKDSAEGMGPISLFLEGGDY